MTIHRVLLALVLISLPAFGQSESFGLALEIRTSYVHIRDGSFKDPKSSLTIGKAGWLNQIRNGQSYEAVLFVLLPYGIKPFVGYHFATLTESGEKNDLMLNIYGQDNSAGFDQSTLETNYRLDSFNAGIFYEPPLSNWLVIPYIGAEARIEKFSAKTQLGGSGQRFLSLLSGNRFSGPVTGTSDFATDANIGFAATFGLRLTIERFSFSPQAKYASSVSNIAVRRSQWTMTLPEGPVGVGWYPDGLPEGHSIRKQYLEVGIGFCYQVL